MTLTRADLESSRLQKLIQQAGLGLQLLSEAELQASLRQTLQQRPHAEVWLFAYGSLIWNPTFHSIGRTVGTIYGLHRQFCLWTPLGRGTPDNPGLVLALDRGGSCRGVAYRIAEHEAFAELLLVWRREMVVNSYVPRWVRVFTGDRTLEAITFVINRQHDCYSGELSLDTVVNSIATACGELGSCKNYLLQTVESLLQAGIQDKYLLSLRDRVLAKQG
jgi:cation transport protein ChaC